VRPSTQSPLGSQPGGSASAATRYHRDPRPSHALSRISAVRERSLASPRLGTGSSPPASDLAGTGYPNTAHPPTCPQCRDGPGSGIEHRSLTATPTSGCGGTAAGPSWRRATRLRRRTSTPGSHADQRPPTRQVRPPPCPPRRRNDAGIDAPPVRSRERGRLRIVTRPRWVRGLTKIPLCSWDDHES
jgi:hypothetical protein